MITESGMWMDERPVCANAAPSIVVTELKMVAFTSEEQYAKVCGAMIAMEFDA